MMLRSKYILLIILLFVGAQFVASQTVVLDSVKKDSLVLRCIEEPMDSVALVDSVKEKQMQDFISLIEKGEEARRREKNELISLVMASVQKKRNSGEIDTIIESIQLEQQFDSIVNNDSLKFTTWMAALTEQEVFISSDSLLAEIDDSLKSRQSSFATKVNPLFVDWVLGTLPAVSVSFDDTDSLIVLLRIRAKSYVRATSPELYTYHRSQLPELSELKINSMSQLQRDKLFLNVDGFNSSKRGMLKIDLPKVSNWTKGAKFQVHASQNYISSNWYKGGESNMAMTMYAIGYFNYDSKKGLQWDNKAEWKLGLYGMASDSLRWLRVNEDLLRLNSKLGYKAFKNFFYTAEWDFQTSLFNTYKSNTYIRTSGPFSPIRMSVSLGVDYKYKSKVSVFLSPLSYKLIYVADMSCKDGVLTTENIAHQIGITDGTCSSNQLGALIRTDFNHDFNESIGMEVHFSFFGNYVGKIKGIEIGCELIGNFKINRFLSAKVSLYPRYDSTTIPTDGGKPKMQFYELISLGFNYKL